VVVSRVAGDRRDHEHQREQRRRERAAGVDRRERARREQQRIAGQERRDHEAGLGEHDREEDRVHPRSIGANQLEQVLVAMKDEVDEL